MESLVFGPIYTWLNSKFLRSTSDVKANADQDSSSDGDAKLGALLGAFTKD
jgi:hypothetical protein